MRVCACVWVWGQRGVCRKQGWTQPACAWVKMGEGDARTNGARVLLFFFYSRVAAAKQCKLGQIPNAGGVQQEGG